MSYAEARLLNPKRELAMALFGQEHVDRYVATDGQEGHEWQGAHTLILTTKGRRSGEPRAHALIYGRHGDDYLVVASKGGAPQHPAWYLNLQAQSEVQIQVQGNVMRAQARTATPEEKAELWPIMTREWSDYDQYQQRTERDIPLVILEPS
jgi:deazaflavin-dependent oxidoreductase (nitroreductase family)